MKKIEFFSMMPGVVDACPIIPAKEYTAKWMELARNDYVEQLKSQVGRFGHVFQCPGIFDLFNHGFIIPAWHDILIKTNGNLTGFSWMTPTVEFMDLTEGRAVVGKHEDGLDKYLPKKPWALNSIIKFNTPWHVVAPKGVKFLVIPVAYTDTYEFESTIGILDPGISSEINIQVYWNIIKGEHVIKAGTPLAHIIPISDEKFEMSCREMTEHDKKWIDKRAYFNNFTFKLKRNLIKDFYYKHFGGK